MAKSPYHSPIWCRATEWSPLGLYHFTNNHITVNNGNNMILFDINGKLVELLLKRRKVVVTNVSNALLCLRDALDSDTYIYLASIAARVITKEMRFNSIDFMLLYPYFGTITYKIACFGLLSAIDINALACVNQIGYQFSCLYKKYHYM